MQSLRIEIDQVCDRFEAQWRTSPEPGLADFLEGWREPDRSALLRELIQIDFLYRRKHNLDLPRDGYSYLAGKEGTWLHDFLADVASEVPGRVESDGTLRSDCSNRTLPRCIDRFEILGALGKGGFGTVYRAFDSVLRREVALKVPHRHVIADGDMAKRFLVEATAAGQLRHPHIVPVHQAGYEGETYFIASAFIEGRTLKQVVEESGPVEPHRAAEIVRQIAVALDYAHGQGVIHRDVKPHNVLIDGDGEAHLMDFGLARLMDSNVQLTQEGAFLGTPAYMSPEQANRDGKSEVGPATDQYSLGVLLYELLTGQLPFKGTSELVVAQVCNEEPAPARKIKAQVPRDLETICHKAMGKEAAHRYASCGELAEDLGRWQQGLPVLARRIGPLARCIRLCRRNPAIASLSLVVFLVLVTTTAVSGWFATNANQRAIEATESAARALEETRIAKRNLYLAHMNQLQHDWSAGRITSMIELLTRYYPAPGQEDLRGFEWYYWNRLCNSHATALDGRYGNVSFSTDGARIVASNANEVTVWDRRTSKRLISLDTLWAPQRFAGRGWVNGLTVASTPDAKLVALATDRGVEVWDTTTGRHTRTLSPRGARVSALAFAPDRNQLIVESNGDEFATPTATIEVFDGDGNITTTIHEHLFMFASPDGLLLLAMADDWSYSVYSTVTGKQILNGLTGVEGFLASGDIVCLQGETIRFLNASSGKQTRSLSLHDQPRWLGPFSPSGDLAIVGFKNGASVIDTTSGDEVLMLNSDYLQSFNATFSLATSELALYRDGKIEFYDWRTRRQTAVMTVGMGYGVAVSPDMQSVATAGNEIKLWNRDTHQETITIHTTDVPVSALSHVAYCVDTVAFEPRGGWFCTSTGADGVRVWSTAGQPLGLLADSENGLVNGADVAIHPGGQRIAVATSRGLRIFDAQTLRQTQLIDNVLGCVAFIPHSSEVAATDRELLKIFDATTGSLVKVLEGHTDTIRSVAASPDGSRIATGGNDNTVRLWDASTGQQLRVLAGPDSPRVTFSPDGRIIVAVGFNDHTVLAWDSLSGEARRFISPVYGAQHIAFSPDGKRMATAKGNTVDVYDTSSGDRLLTLMSESSHVFSLAFGSDGLQLSAGGFDGLVTIWDARPTSRERH